MGFRKKEVKEVSVNHPLVQKKINNSLDLSIREGSFSSVTNGLGTSYLTPYALALNATSAQVGFLSAIVSLFPSLFQLKAARMVEKYSRKRIVLFYIFFQALMFIPIILSGILFMLGFSNVAWILIGLITLFYVLGAIPQPAWFSWMGSLVPEQERGEYFAKRNRITGFFGLISMVLGAITLDYSKDMGYLIIGFGILFLISMFMRFISIIIFAKQYEPKLKVHKKDYFSFWQFLKRAKDTPFGRFSYFTTIMRVATNLGSPFFTVYLLSGLGLSYSWFMAITVSGAVFQLLFYPLIGKLSDRFGNIRLLRISCFAIALVPFLYLVSTNPFFLATIPEIIGGFGWAGFNLATNNYVYDSVKQEKRSLGITYFNLLNGIGLFVGAAIGSLIALCEIPFMGTLLFIIMLSGILRLLVLFFGANYLKEVRHVKRFRYQFMFKEIVPVQGILREVHHFNGIKGRITHFV